MDIKKLKNWKEHPKFLELKSRLENEKVRKSLRWVFEIAVTLALCRADSGADVPDCDNAGKLYGADSVGGGPFLYESRGL